MLHELRKWIDDERRYRQAHRILMKLSPDERRAILAASPQVKEKIGAILDDREKRRSG